MHDIRRVSELAEGSVHALSAKHGGNLRNRPHYQLYVHARWLARDLAAGGHRIRLLKDVALPERMLSNREDPYDFEKDFADRDTFLKLEERLRESGRDDARKVIEMYLSGSAHQIP